MGEQDPTCCFGKLPLRKGCFCIGIATAIIYAACFIYDFYWVMTVPRTGIAYLFIAAILLGEFSNIVTGILLSIGTKKDKNGLLMPSIITGLITFKVFAIRQIFAVRFFTHQTTYCSLHGCSGSEWLMWAKVGEILVFLTVMMLQLYFSFHVYKLWKENRASGTTSYVKQGNQTQKV